MAATLDDITILCQSDNYLVVDKHYDVRINSNDPSHEVTVEHQLRQKCPESVDNSVVHGFRFPHRLDHATSGVLCLSLSKPAAAKFTKCMTKSKILKHYIALVRGHMEPAPSPSIIRDIRVDIGRDTSETDFQKMCVSSDSHCDTPRDAHTGLVVLQHGVYDGQPASKILLLPYTGRTHQLRVHCRHVGHMIVGDYMYSNRADTAPYRMMLHAYRLILPIYGEPMDLVAPDPFLPDVDALWKPERTLLTYDDFIKLQAEQTNDKASEKEECVKQSAVGGDV